LWFRVSGVNRAHLHGLGGKNISIPFKSFETFAAASHRGSRGSPGLEMAPQRFEKARSAAGNGIILCRFETVSSSLAKVSEYEA
jgi:hypothetical protein